MHDIKDNLSGYFGSDESLVLFEDDDFKVGFEIEHIDIGRAEPDVGFMEDYVADYSFTGYVGDKTFENDARGFAREICSVFGDDTQYEAVFRMLLADLDDAANDMM